MNMTGKFTNEKINSFIYSKRQARTSKELFQDQLGNDILVFPQLWVQNQNNESFTQNYILENTHFELKIQI